MNEPLLLLLLFAVAPSQAETTPNALVIDETNAAALALNASLQAAKAQGDAKMAGEADPNDYYLDNMLVDDKDSERGESAAASAEKTDSHVAATSVVDHAEKSNDTNTDEGMEGTGDDEEAALLFSTSNGTDLDSGRFVNGTINYADVGYDFKISLYAFVIVLILFVVFAIALGIINASTKDPIDKRQIQSHA